jgi:predicted sugar kinase
MMRGWRKVAYGVQLVALGGLVVTAGTGSAKPSSPSLVTAPSLVAATSVATQTQTANDGGAGNVQGLPTDDIFP